MPGIPVGAQKAARQVRWVKSQCGSQAQSQGRGASQLAHGERTAEQLPTQALGTRQPAVRGDTLTVLLGEARYLAMSMSGVRIVSGREALRVEGESGTRDGLDGIKLVLF